jgi:hypothetical protein
MGALMRIALAAALWICVLGTTCTKSKDLGLAVVLGPTVDLDSAANEAFAVGERTAARFGLQRWHAPDAKALRIRACFWGGGALSMCDKLLDREVQFRILERAGGEFTPLGDSLVSQLTDSLRRYFGDDRVRTCDWELPRDRRRWGCPPAVQRDSG